MITEVVRAFFEEKRVLEVRVGRANARTRQSIINVRSNIKI
jgi:hypothetical protein